MASGTRSILIDVRVNALAGAHGLARSVMKLAEHMPEPGGGLALRVLANPDRPQLFPLSALPAHAEVVGTDITLGAVHRCRELGRVIGAAGAAVLYSPYPTFTPIVRPCPLVVTIHDCTIESDRAFAGSWFRQAGLKVVTRTVLRWATATTAPTRASLAEIRQHYPSAPHPTLVPNGVDLEQFGTVTPGSAAAVRDLYRLPEQFILTVGARRPHKNHETLVRVLADLPADMSLVIVGVPDLSFPDPLPGVITELGLESRVRLLPEVAEKWLPALYQAASAFAFPSLAEGYGLPVLEAMAAGVPVVSSDIPALAEVARSAAIRLPPTNVAAWVAALTRVIGDPGLRARMSAAGREVAAGVSWERGASRLSGLLSAVADGSLVAAPYDAPAPDGAVPGTPVAAR